MAPSAASAPDSSISPADHPPALAHTERAWFVEDGGWELDVATSRLSWSPRGRKIAERVLGFVPETPRELWSGLGRKEAQKAARLVEALKSGGKDVAQVVMTFTRPDGKAATVCIRAVPRLGSNGLLTRISGTVALGQDILFREQSPADDAFRVLADESTDLILHLGPDGRIRYAGPQVRRYFGLEPQSLMDRTLTEAGIDLHVSTEIASLLEQVAESRFPLSAKISFLLSPGRPVHLDLKLWPELDEDGALSSVLIHGSDITRRQRTEQGYYSLFSSLLHGFALFELLPAPVDREDVTLLLMNPPFCRLMGLGMDAAGKSLDRVLREDARPWKELFASVLRDGRAHSCTLAVGGGDRYLELAAYQPEPQRIACIVRDITKERSADKKALLNISRLTTLYTVSSMAAAESDDSVLASFALQELARLTGSQSACLFLSMPDSPTETILFRESGPADGRSDIREHCLVSFARKLLYQGDRGQFGILEQPESLSGFPLRAERLMAVPVSEWGHLRCLALLAEKPEPYEEYEFLQIRLLLSGIWECFRRRQAVRAGEQKLLRYQEEAASRTNLLMLLSHELRSSLTSICGMLQMLGVSRLSTEQREYAETAMQSSHSLIRLLSDVTDFSLLDTGKVSLTDSAFSPGELCGRMHQLLKVETDARGVAFQLQLDEGLPREVSGDERKISQVLSQLLSNALKFTSQGSVTLACQMVGGPGHPRLLLTVSDTGTGIADDRMDEIFSAHQTMSAGNRLYPGIGLGLAICRGLAHLMDAGLCVTSTLGEGTEAYFSVPVTVPEELSSPLAEAQDAVKPLNILLVEDDAVNRFTILSLLRHLGHKITSVENGHEALEILLENRSYDCILSDIEMPVMDGIELAQRFRDHEERAALPATPMLAITAHALEGDKERFLQAGFDYYIAKPIALTDLLAALRWVDGRKQS